MCESDKAISHAIPQPQKTGRLIAPDTAVYLSCRSSFAYLPLRATEHALISDFLPMVWSDRWLAEEGTGVGSFPPKRENECVWGGTCNFGSKTKKKKLMSKCKDWRSQCKVFFVSPNYFMKAKWLLTCFWHFSDPMIQIHQADISGLRKIMTNDRFQQLFKIFFWPVGCIPWLGFVGKPE